MRAWWFTVGFKLPNCQIAVMSGPDGAKELLTILKVPDRQGGLDCQWVVEGSLVCTQ